MQRATIDALMITYNRPEYTRLALGRLLETADEDMRVWVWHNGRDASTLEVVESFRSHPRLHRFHHSPENKKLREPTNWLWKEAAGDLLSKVDDDCLVPMGWTDALRDAHARVPELGVIGCWRFLEEDFVPEAAQKKIRELRPGLQLLQNPWVEGSGYLVKRACLEAVGALGPEQTFTNWCIEVAHRGWVNGWLYPFLYQEHMDDPRTPHSLLKTDADLAKYMPLSAIRSGIDSLEAWQEQLRRSARTVQEASLDPRDYRGWRKRLRNARKRLRRILGEKGSL